MTEMTEGALTFTFNAGWEVGRYDEWAYCRNQFHKTKALTDVKAVDFIAINGDTAWLIEVKDYRRHPRTKSIDLADEIAKKVYDTLSGVASAKFNASGAEKLFARQFFAAHSLHVVLHLEQPAKHSKLFPRAIDPANVTLKLRRQIKAIDPHPQVLEKRITNPTTHWSVA